MWSVKPSTSYEECWTTPLPPHIGYVTTALIPHENINIIFLGIVHLPVLFKKQTFWNIILPLPSSELNMVVKYWILNVFMKYDHLQSSLWTKENWTL
jgi:hypothetical protein